MTHHRLFIFWHIALGLAAMTALPIALLVSDGVSGILLSLMVLGFASILLACLSYDDHQPWLENASLGFSLLLIGGSAFISAPFAPILWVLLFLPFQAHFLFHGRLFRATSIIAGAGLLLAYGLGFQMVHLSQLELNFTGLVIAMAGLSLCTYYTKILIEGSRHKHLGKLPSGSQHDLSIKNHKNRRVTNSSDEASIQGFSSDIDAPKSASLSQKLRKIQPVPAECDKDTVYLNHMGTSNVPLRDFKDLTIIDEYTGSEKHTDIGGHMPSQAYRPIDECIGKLEIVQDGLLKNTA